MNYTKTNHTTPYASISPLNPSLSAHSKTVLITGASSGIASATATAFLEAGCIRLILVTRKPETISSTVNALQSKFKNAKVLTFAADIQDASALDKAFTDTKEIFGAVDVVVNFAGYQPSLAPLAKTDMKDWWAGFEVNVRGPAVLAQIIASLASPSAVFLHIGTAGALFPAQIPMSGYAVSKLAAIKLMEYFGAENPGLRVLTVHPGIVPGTEGGQKMVKESGVEWQGDDVDLPAHFLVWAASEEAKFLKSKLVFANWDVDELKARQNEIEGSCELMIGLNGFPRQVE
ncbi:hypothetical protein GGR57DRAFT_213280 [Xylariaceae sp. FL1272]|nr:hypothetical protein GGR57DRAFT_213280 [Xylariaceae sp. FL1272]